MKLIRRHYEFKLEPAQEEYLKQRVQFDKKFAEYSKRNVKLIIAKQIYERLVEREANVIFSICGITGSGKSMAGLSLACFMAEITKTPLVPKHSICYTPQDFLSSLEIRKKFETLILDEQVRMQGIGKHRQLDEIRNAEEVLRKKQINFIFISPNVKEHPHQFYFETFGIDKEKNVSRLLTYVNNTLIGYITVRLPPKHIIDQYMPLKDEFINRVQQGKTSSKEHWKGLAEELAEDEEFQLCKNKTEKETIAVDKFPDLGVREIELIIAKANIIMRKNA